MDRIRINFCINQRLYKVNAQTWPSLVAFKINSSFVMNMPVSVCMTIFHTRLILSIITACPEKSTEKTKLSQLELSKVLTVVCVG